MSLSSPRVRNHAGEDNQSIVTTRMRLRLLRNSDKAEKEFAALAAQNYIRMPACLEVQMDLESLLGACRKLADGSYFCFLEFP